MRQAETPDRAVTEDLERHILQAIKDVRYGSVEIVIHDSQVVQIERKEKMRFPQARAENKK